MRAYCGVDGNVLVELQPAFEAGPGPWRRTVCWGDRDEGPSPRWCQATSETDPLATRKPTPRDTKTDPSDRGTTAGGVIHALFTATVPKQPRRGGQGVDNPRSTSLANGDSRTGGNPRTGESIDITASTATAFKAGKTLRDAA